MTEPAWKVVVDGDSLTIVGNAFSLTTSGSDPGVLDTAVSELQAVARGTYGQYCGLARAVEAVGERWGMLIVRDLLVSEKSAGELSAGLPGVPRSLVSMRLKEMAYSGIVEMDESVDAQGGTRYRLTEYGRGLDKILLELGRWGSVMLAEPRAEDVVTEDSLITGMRASFVPAAAKGRSERFEVHFDTVVIHLVVEDGQLQVGRGPLPGASVVAPGPLLKDMLSRRTSVSEAVATGTVPGDTVALETFLAMFELPGDRSPATI